jgi:hypothetical protein
LSLLVLHSDIQEIIITILVGSGNGAFQRAKLLYEPRHAMKLDGTTEATLAWIERH